jgi:hypothetical protein
LQVAAQAPSCTSGQIAVQQGQLLEAFLIAQDKNKNDKPLYGFRAK